MVRSGKYIQVFQWVCLCFLTVASVSFVACEKKEYPYDSCEKDNDCKSNYNCRGGRCEKVDLTCQTDSDCKGGRKCIKSLCQNLICQENRDCEKDEWCNGGVCRPLAKEPTHPDAGTERSPSPDAKPGKDGSHRETHPEQKTEQKPDRPPAFCTPNRNGKLERSELLFKVGTSVTYREAASVTVDLKGSTNNEGKTVWNFVGPYAGSKKVVDELQPMKGAWFEKLYPDATYASILDRSLGLVGVFQVTGDALLMRGVASEKASSTKLKYDTPIKLFQFPMEVGTKWTSTGTSTGTMRSVPFFRMHETYVFEVDAKGIAKTPAGEFPVIRLKLKLTQQQYSPALFRRTGYTYYFLSECFGIVARVDSKQYETNPLFTRAASLKLLSE